jgi:hypothetical protein
MAEVGEKDGLSKVSTFSSITARLAAVLGIIIALFQLNSFLKSATTTLDALKLQALDKVVGILQADAEMQKNQSAYLTSSTAKLQEKTLDAFLRKNGNGQEFYWSDQGKPFTQIAEHYERLGAILRLGYLDFDILFEIVPFPDKFWTDTAALRQKLRENWRGERQSLPDLLDNFRWLCKRYEKERARHNYESAKGMKCDS